MHVYTHKYSLLDQWGFISPVQYFPPSSRICQIQLTNQMQSVHSEQSSCQPDFVLTLKAGAPDSITTLLWVTVDYPSHLWLMSLQPHPATLSLLPSINSGLGSITQFHPHCSLQVCPMSPSLFLNSHTPQRPKPNFLVHPFLVFCLYH